MLNASLPIITLQSDAKPGFLSTAHFHTKHVMLHRLYWFWELLHRWDTFTRLTMKMGFWSVEALSFLAWLLGRSRFISPLYWGRHCINRHTGNRPSLSEEPLRRAPGPMARFTTLRYRPYITDIWTDVLWNPFTFWEQVVVNSLKYFQSAQI